MPLDVVISGKFGVQDFSYFSVSVVLSTRMGKTNDRAGYKKSGKKKGSETMSSIWDIPNLKHPGDFFFFKILFIYLSETESTSRGRGRQREKQAPH